MRASRARRLAATALLLLGACAPPVPPPEIAPFYTGGAPPVGRCAWTPYASRELGIRVDVRPCLAQDLEVVGDRLVTGRGGRQRPQGFVVLEVRHKPADQTIQAAIHEQFIEPLPARVHDNCLVNHTYEDGPPSPSGHGIYDVWPPAWYFDRVQRESEEWARDYDCGNPGLDDFDGWRYFIYHPAQSRTRFVVAYYTVMGQIIDPDSLVFTDDDP